MTPDEIKARFDRHEKRISALETGQKVMGDAVDEIKKDTREIVGLLRDAKGAWAVLDLLGKLGKSLAWIAAFAAACGVVWAQWTGHKP